MIERVITGGQTGADQAGWRAARAAGIPTGGWMPRGFLTEDGPRPEFAGLYGAREHQNAEYSPRTEKNVQECDSILWFGGMHTPGFRLTIVRFALDFEKPWYVVGSPTWRGDERDPPIDAWIRTLWGQRRGRKLLVAGNRESKAPGIGDWVERYMAEVFRLLREG